MILRITVGLVLTVVALAIAGRRVWWLKRLAFSGQPAPERVGTVREHPGRDIESQATEVIGQRKLLKWTVPGAAHAATFWGFIVLIPSVPADLRMRAGTRSARQATIWRVITGADAEVFDATVRGWLTGQLPGERAARDDASGRENPAGLMLVRPDGKTARGAKDADGNQRHLPAVLAGRTAQSSVIAA